MHPGPRQALGWCCRDGDLTEVEAGKTAAHLSPGQAPDPTPQAKLWPVAGISCQAKSTEHRLEPQRQVLGQTVDEEQGSSHQGQGPGPFRCRAPLFMLSRPAEGAEGDQSHSDQSGP